MTTTDTPTGDRAERLARLEARRAGAGPTQPTAGGSVRRARTRRRSPAAAAKIFVAGTSTTAVLAMMAAYGVAERPTDTIELAVPASGAWISQDPGRASADSGRPRPGVTTTSTIGPAAAPVDVHTDRPTTASPDTATTPGRVVIVPGPPPEQPPPPRSTAIARPVAVDLAVPAPPPPPRVATPAPEATSSGS